MRRRNDDGDYKKNSETEEEEEVKVTVSVEVFSFVSSALVLVITPAEVMSHEITVKCREYYGFPPISNTTPSFLADLKGELVTVEENTMLNISWAVNIDASIKYLKGTYITIDGESYHCDYKPHLSEDITESKQRWFSFLKEASNGFTSIQVTNLPLPPLGSDSSYKTLLHMNIPKQSMQVSTASVTLETAQVSTVETTASTVRGEVEHITIAIVGGLAFLMILTMCCIICKCCGANIATSMGFKHLPQSPMVPVDVLVVYPAENSAFQQVVVALAEFLQWHGGCRVAIDMWQQQKIAELGPMRWLAQQAKDADQILIICPQASSQPSCSPSNHNFPESPIPAAAHDLFPLILNMVASHAKNTSDLAKFWLVQFDKQQNRMPSTMPLELRACKSFCLMKDLNKLCKSLHSQSQKSKLSQVTVSEKSTSKLRDAVEKHFQKCGATEKCGHLCLNIGYENM
ncbi:hypothetical protein JOB18_031183 [Solea senegalensis]|uniref:SEFIR domain-containing protein n=1 Tax=Solea senegalensis TaxID=28829 RepID=A0AAV6SST3_SOLSE|nr:hypothetical protein JOB18_031183 [Solea senegalensis]